MMTQLSLNHVLCLDFIVYLCVYSFVNLCNINRTAGGITLYEQRPKRCVSHRQPLILTTDVITASWGTEYSVVGKKRFAFSVHAYVIEWHIVKKQVLRLFFTCVSLCLQLRQPVQHKSNSWRDHVARAVCKSTCALSSWQLMWSQRLGGTEF